MSVIVPVRNNLRHLQRTLPEMRAALGEDWELIVVDDHSTDDSAEFSRSWADRVITSGWRQSGPAARNTGARVARGSVLVFLDADILPTRQALQRLVAGLEEHRAALVFGVYSENPDVRTFCGRFKNLWVRHSYLKSAARVRWMNTAITAIRRDDFEAVGGFEIEDDWRQGGNDIDFGRVVAERLGAVVLMHDVDAHHLKELNLIGLLRNDYNRTRGFFRRSVMSREIQTVARGKWFGNISPTFMGGVITASLIPAGLMTMPLQPGLGAGLAIGAGLIHGAMAFPFYLYAVPRLGLLGLTAPVIYWLDHLACAAGLAVEIMSMGLRRSRLRPAMLDAPLQSSSRAAEDRRIS